MNFVLEPTVTLMWTPQFHEHPTLRLPPDGDDATRIGAFAAKTCYRSFGETGRSCADNQQRIIEERHGRILQHINFGVHVEGISRALGNELITHQAGITVSQESTRYTDQGDAAFVLEPWQAAVYAAHPELTRAVAESRTFEELERLGELAAAPLDELTRRKVGVVGEALRNAAATFASYGRQDRELQEIFAEEPMPEETPVRRNKRARGIARNSLVLGLETALVMTGNLRAWRNFVEARSSRWAEAEIRRLTKHLVKVLAPAAPLYWQDHTVEEVWGLPEFTTPYGKV